MRTQNSLNYNQLAFYLILFCLANFVYATDLTGDVIWYDWSKAKAAYISRNLYISKVEKKDDKLGFIRLYLMDEGRERADENELIELVDESDSQGLELKSEYIVDDRQVKLTLIIYDHLIDRVAIEKSFNFSNDYRLEIAIAFEALFRELGHYIKDYNEPLMGKLSGTFDYLLQLDGKVAAVPIYSNKKTLIIYNKNRENYSILCRGKRYEAIEGIVPLIIDLNSVDKLKIFYSEREKRAISLILSPGPKVVEHQIKLPAEKAPFKSRFALDISYSQTTGGYMGSDINLSLGFKKRRAFSDSLYFRWHFSLKTLHLAEQNIDPLKATNFRFKTGVGYRHQFNLNGLLSIGTGVETGIEFYLLKKLYYSIFSYESADIYFPGFPTFYLSIPFYIEILPFSRVSIFAAVEPTFRVISKVIYHDGYVWRDNFEIDGYEENYFRITLERYDYSSPYTALDLFLNDIPITIGIRVKI